MKSIAVTKDGEVVAFYESVEEAVGYVAKTTGAEYDTVWDQTESGVFKHKGVQWGIAERPGAALAAMRRRTWHKCAVCEKRFSGTSRAKFCSNACKQKDKYARTKATKTTGGRT